MILPSHEYWPLRPGSRIAYKPYLIEGYFHADTFELDVNKREPDPSLDEFWRTVVALPQPRMPVVATVHSTPGVVPTPAMDWSQASPLYQLMWKPASGRAYIGEAGSDCAEGLPPDPILTFDPVPGERLTVDINGYLFDAKTGATTPSNMRATYGTISNQGHWWADRFPDTIRTGLVERPGEPEGYCYNYLWAKDIGPINLWWGWKDKFNHVAGWEWQITSHS